LGERDRTIFGDHDGQPRFEREAAAGPAVVWQVWGAVHCSTDTVTSKLYIYADARFECDRSDRVGDITDFVSHHGGSDPGVECTLGEGADVMWDS
jgi:hypothetical protein